MSNQSIVIDADSHVMEPADLWTTYLEEKYRSRAIRIEVADGVESLVIDDQPVLTGRLAGLGGVHIDRTKVFGPGMTYRDGCPAASYDPSARAELYDEWDVDVGVLFPTIGILPFPTYDQDLASAYCRAYNRWVFDHHNAIADRTIAIAIINWASLDHAVEELKAIIKMGFRGLFVPPEVINDMRPGHTFFDPIWQLCADAGIPGCLHVIVRFEGAAVPFRAWHATGAGPLFTFGLGAVGQLEPALASMIIDGLFDRWPTLKILAVEAGCGWAAHLMDRLDQKYQYFRELVTTPLKLKPSEYIRRNCYFTAEPEERTIGAMLDLVGEDRIVWGSDFPHIDSTLQAPHLIRAAIADLTPARQQAVLGANAAKIFQIQE
jgi:predicted TIM-barrel fold metal-dependent hydrolase|tara:strand:- start:1020 stop:2150 length:1131 start_codon:yes stop_codon:yes gene_type:complete